MQSLKLAWYNVLRNRRRSLFTILITTVATTVLLAGGGFCLYMYQGLEEESARDTGHIILSKKGFFEADEDFPLQFGMNGYKDIQSKYRRDDDVRAVLPHVEFQGLISNGEKTVIFSGMGVEHTEFMVRGPFITFTQGSALSSQPATIDINKDPEILLAVGLAKNLKVNVGDSITLLSTTTENVMNGMDFTVKGIFTSGIPELDKRLIYTDIHSAQTLLDSQLVSTVAIHLFDSDLVNEKIFQLQQGEQFQADLQVTPWWERAFYYRDVKNLFDRIFGLLGIIIAVMVFLAISNTMSMAVMERTREIGTLAAMGTYRHEIIRSFTMEGLVIGVVGTLAGVVLNLAIFILLNVANIEMPPPPGSTVGFPVAINLSWTLTFASVFLLSVICATAAWLAARNGARKPIVEALAYV